MTVDTCDSVSFRRFEQIVRDANENIHVKNSPKILRQFAYYIYTVLIHFNVVYSIFSVYHFL